MNKKKWALLGATALMSGIFLTGCGGDNVEADAVEASYEFNETTRTFQSSRGRITMTTVGFQNPRDADTFRISYTLENTSDEEYTVYELLNEFVLVTQDGSMLDWRGQNPPRHQAVEPGETVTGTIAWHLDNIEDDVTVEFFDNLHMGEVIGTYIWAMEEPQERRATSTTLAAEREDDEEEATTEAVDTNISSSYWHSGRNIFTNDQVELRVNDVRVGEDRDDRPAISFSLSIENVSDTAQSIDELTSGIVFGRQGSETLTETSMALRNQNMRFIVEPGASTTVFFNFVLANESGDVHLFFYQNGVPAGVYTYSL